ncbi:YsnF/AvaK domain-containing protein [Paenibacillus dakarensis]|uniref:YsnF/AvaK domain-containing protein n=1 Tax=Paenibacillus dakarensis TaxID=1527293 RepID=UPI0009E7C4D9|nr:YsnF/AvaK domain-containing protein [Paenibacillus dakarensis]
MTQRIVGAFSTEQEATQAIEDLKQQGFGTEEISVIAKDRDDVTTINEETGTKAPEGLASGAATGGILGGVTGLLAGLGALAIPGIGPIVAAGPIAATLTGAAVGAGAGGLVGGLIGLGIPEDEAKEYDEYVEEGRILVLVETDEDRTNKVYDTFRRNNTLNEHHYNQGGSYTGNTGLNLDSRTESAAAAEETVQDPNLYQGYGAGMGNAGMNNAGTGGAAGTGTGDIPEHYTNRQTDTDLDTDLSDRLTMENDIEDTTHRTMPLREEKLDINKERVQSGEVTLHKEVIEEQKTIEVPVTHEEVVVERRAVSDGSTANGTIGEDETIRIPVSEERVEVNKRPVVTGEVEVRKEEVQDTEHVQDTVKKEQAHVDKSGNLSVRGLNEVDEDSTAVDGTDLSMNQNNSSLNTKKF